MHLVFDAKKSGDKNPDQEQDDWRLNSMVDCHSRVGEWEGVLAKFSASPQINRNVYALVHTDGMGMERTFTVLNEIRSAEDMELFNQITDYLDGVWDSAASQAERRRNFWVNPDLKLSIQGKFNFVSQIQANPQLFISGLEDIQFKP